MNKILFLQYIQDRRYLLLVYAFTSVNLIVYFLLLTEGSSSVLYPILLAVVPLLLVVLLDSVHYIRFQRQLLAHIRGENVQLSPSTNEQHHMQKLLTQLTVHGSNEFRQLKGNYQEHLYFSSHLMHHLQGPLSVMDLMLEDNLTTDEMRSVMQKQVNRMKLTVNQALSLVRSESFERDLTPEAVDLVRLLDDLIEDMRDELTQTNVLSQLVSAQQPIFVVSDFKWLKVSLQQLIGNAVKYSALVPGMKMLKLVVERCGENVFLHIIDEGPGIPFYDQPKLFEPFFTGENGRAVNYSSGIGLYLCQKICTQLGHSLRFQSEQGKGTTFSIEMKASTKTLH